MAKFKDLTGSKFGRLFVINQSEKHIYPSGSSRITWNCKCDCGSILKVRSNSLTSGNTTSCGCLQIEKTKERSITHGMTKSPEYRTWQNAKRRCLNPKSKDYEYYGGRGIAMCEEWINDFETFLKDMGNRPKNGTLERINVNLGYCAENCKWATMKEQCNNRSNNRLIEYNGEIKTLQQWADIIGVHSDKVRHRVNKGKTINEIYKLNNDGKSYFSDNSKDSILFN